MKPLSRRSVIAGSAAVVTAIPVVGLCKDAEGPSELVAIVQRYFAELDAFCADPRDDDEFCNADQPFDATLQQMIGVRVRSSNDDAAAAVDMVLECGRGCMIDFGENPYGRVAEWCLHALRDYLAGRVAHRTTPPRSLWPGLFRCGAISTSDFPRTSRYRRDT